MFKSIQPVACIIFGVAVTLLADAYAATADAAQAQQSDDAWQNDQLDTYKSMDESQYQAISQSDAWAQRLGIPHGQLQIFDEQIQEAPLTGGDMRAMIDAHGLELKVSW